MKKRFVSQWISAYTGPDDPDGFDPDCYEYESSTITFEDDYTNPGRLRKDAERFAKHHAKKAGVVGDWWRVFEDEFDPNYYGRREGGWQKVAAWTCGMPSDV